MKTKLLTLSTCLFILQLAYQFTCANEALSIGEAVMTNAVLQESEISGIKISKTNMRPWWKGMDANGKSDETNGVEQNLTIQNVKAFILYAEFANSEEAHQAAEFHSKNMASIFQAGLWRSAEQKTIGDESWYTQDATTTALLIRSGRTCVLVSCHDGDVKNRSQVAEMIGKRIEGKIKSGGRVRVPRESLKD